MSEPRNFTALDWVKGEIEDTLRAARESLEAFADSPDEITLARQCLTGLHQVNGTLQMVELHGAAALAAEMETLAQALLNRSIEDRDGALEALMEGILQLPSHLNRVHRGAEDDPRIHGQLIDRMRVARGESPLLPPSAMNADAAAVADFSGGAGLEEVRRLRTNYQKAMLALIRRTQPVERLYPFLDRVFTRLAAVTPASRLARLWGLAAGVMELRGASDEPPEPLVPLLRALDHQLRELVESPPLAIAATPPRALQEGLAAIVMGADGVLSARITALQASLAEPDDRPDPGPVGADDETIATVAAALHEELAGVRDRLDLYVRGSVSDADGLLALGTDLQRVAGTLQVVGLQELRETIATQAAWLRQQANQDRVDEESIMDVAGAVLMVDAALMSLAGIESDDADGMPGSVSDAHSAVLREARASLEAVKQGIVDFIASEWDHVHLENVPATLAMVRSVLQVVPLPRAAALVEACRGFVEEQLLAERSIPEWQRLDHLADALTSIDYFLERMLEDRVIPDPRMLEIAEESIEQLGQPVAPIDPADLATPPAPSDLDAEAGALESVDSEPVVTVDSAAADDVFDPEDPNETLVRLPADEAADADDASSGDARGDADSGMDAAASADQDPEDEAGERDPFGLGPAIGAIGDQDSGPGAAGAPAGDGPLALAVPMEDDFDLGFEIDVDPGVHDSSDDSAHVGSGVVADGVGAPEAAQAGTDAAVVAAAGTDAPTEPTAETGSTNASNEDLIDDEIIEIFLEEVLEVLEQLDASLPVWQSDCRDRTALGEIRRAWHTLKGSGRMVGASVLGELAWSVENMLNRVLDGTIEASPTVIDLTVRARAVLPELRQAFGRRAAPTLDVAPLMERADVLASGGGPDELDDLDAPTGAPEEPGLVNASLDDPEAGEAAPGADFDLDVDAFLEGREGREVQEGPAVSAAGADDVPADSAMDTAGDTAGGTAAAATDAQSSATATDAASSLTAPTEDDFDLGAEFGRKEDAADTDTDTDADADADADARAADVAAGSGPSLFEIFEEEASEHLRTAHEFLDRARAASEPPPLSDDLRRALHTLKGSAAMAEFPGLAELAAPLERLARASIDLRRPVDGPVLDVLEQGLRRIEAGLDHLRQSGCIERVFDSAERDYLERAERLLAELDDPRSADAVLDAAPASGVVLASEGIDLLLDAGSILRNWAADGMEARLEALRAELRAVDGRARGAGQDVIAELAGALGDAHERIGSRLPVAAQAPLERAHETLLGMLDSLAAGLEVRAAPEALEEVAQIKEAAAVDATADTAAESAITEGADDVPDAEEDDGVLRERIADLDLDPEMVEIFFEEADELLEVIEQALEAWPAGDDSAADELLRALHTLKGGARMAGLSGLGAEAHDVETWIADARTAADAPGFFSELRRRADLLGEHVVALRRGESIVVHVAGASDAPAAQSPVPTRDAREAVAGTAVPPDLRESSFGSVTGEDAPLPPPTVVEDDPTESPSESSDAPTATATATATATVSADADAAFPDAADLAETDPEILALFLEEAAELNELLDGSLAGWTAEPDNEIHLEGLLRALHTLKGGARMAGLEALGEAAHDIETALVAQRGRGTPDAAFLAQVQTRVDAFSERTQALGGAADIVNAVGATHGAPAAANEGAAAPPAGSSLDADADADADARPDADATSELDDPDRIFAEPLDATGGAAIEGDDSDFDVGAAFEPDPSLAVAAARAEPVEQKPLPPAMGATRDAGEGPRGEGPLRETQQEMIRVSSGLLDDLVSLAGETSIMRGRVQQEISDFGAALDEMAATIERIQEQVRRLDSAAQEQILFRQEVAQKSGQPGREDFDPLEMDRYTRLQELTRTLLESASDIGDLRETLVERRRGTETLLLQQARINTELQEGLMRTRMVPFARLLPRLKRIVRQVGRELGKPVELEVENAEGELDRNVLERMIAPLEHMLRNAVDHGIEKPELRAERGKPQLGTIHLRLAQEGGEILIEVKDDGGGINAAGVRAKAIERGLLAPDAEPSEAEILSFIMAPGFSTAMSVTQISGRGVGMDVVNSEVKQLGGSIDIASTLREGTTFSVRLPFTVSVSRALMVTLDTDVYAVPLTGIEGIVRVSPTQLQRRYEGGATGFAYAGRTYELSYLGEWMGRPRTVRQDVPSIPVLMVRSGDQSRAVHVDAVSGSREIVVKGLGPQFAGVAGVSGATILGDGSVVVILDLPALLRSGAAQALRAAEPAPAPVRKLHVLVVDDSVTVRKVTSRLLERNGFEVTLAKDGVEAVSTLSEMRPDVILLDIEMPRMDGFEVATHVRNEARLAELPIIMISSRTGDKHRERAEAIGVDRFLGKPFQEPELLATIRELTES